MGIARHNVPTRVQVNGGYVLLQVCLVAVTTQQQWHFDIVCVCLCVDMLCSTIHAYTKRSTSFISMCVQPCCG